MAKKTQEPTPRFRITFGQIKAAARITHSRDVLKANNYFMADSSPAGDYHAVSAVDHRLADGSGNDVTRPTMGQTGRRAV